MLSSYVDFTVNVSFVPASTPDFIWKRLPSASNTDNKSSLSQMNLTPFISSGSSPSQIYSACRLPFVPVYISTDSPFVVPTSTSSFRPFSTFSVASSLLTLLKKSFIFNTESLLSVASVLLFEMLVIPLKFMVQAFDGNLTNTSASPDTTIRIAIFFFIASISPYDKLLIIPPGLLHWG